MKTRWLVLLIFTIPVVAQIGAPTYQFSKHIAEKIEKDTLPWKYQLGATEYAISQYYQKALETWDKNGSRIRKLTAEDSLYFNSFEQRKAKDYLIERSKNEKIIIINEAHHNSRHRVFTTSLLKGLYDNGYRFLGLEALSDSLINKRKFAIKESGYYTQEPQMANLIHEAIQLGFTVFGYETQDNSNGKEREIQQAANIAKVISENPKAKFLIHCGYDHAIEGTPGDKSWEKAMAGRLKEMTQIDPFSIDQVAYSEKSDLKLSSPYIAMTKATEPVILVNKNGKTFNGNPANDQTDCRIIHPITQYINQRPDWLLMGGKRKPYSLPKNKISTTPLLVLAYRKNEFEPNGIPADIIEITQAADAQSLILENGTYQIVLQNTDYRIIDQFQVALH